MWRSSFASSSKKVLLSSLSAPAYHTTEEITRPLLSSFQFFSTAATSQSTIPTSQSLPSTSDPLKLGLGFSDKSDGIRAFASSSAAAFSLSSLVSSKSLDVGGLARHYGQCYWELSKARLRYELLLNLFFRFAISVQLFMLWPSVSYGLYG